MAGQPRTQVRDLDILVLQLARRPGERHLAELVVVPVGLPIGDDRYQPVVTIRRQRGADGAHERGPVVQQVPESELGESGPCPNTTVIDPPPGRDTR